MTRRHLIPLMLVLVAAVACPLRADDSLDADLWYILMLGEERAGYAHNVIEDDGEQVRTLVEVNISIRRGAIPISMRQTSEFLETAAGEAIESRATTLMGNLEIVQTMRFTDQGIEMTTRQGEATQTQQFPPIEEDWQTPAEIHRLHQKVLAEGGDQFTVRTIEPTLGPKPLEMTLTRVGEENVEVVGKVVPAQVWDMTMSMMPNASIRMYLDGEGNAIKQTLGMIPGMDVTMLLADEALATSDIDPPELMASTLIKPAASSQPVNDARTMRSAIYELTLANEVDPGSVDLPSAGVQRVVWGDQRTARVIVDLDQPVAPGTDLPQPQHSAVSSALRHDDPAVVELLAQALGDDADGLSDADKARRLREFVHEYIDEKDLSVGFATASEVARTAQGDCTEHAVLLAALLRAAGIPSRAVTGVVYVDAFLGERDVFGYHMWTQAFFDDGGGGRWVDLDATLPAAEFDAGHIALTLSSLADDTLINNMVAVAPLLGTLRISVVEVDGGGGPSP